LQIGLDFYVCSARWVINLSQTKNRLAEKTLFFSACCVTGFLMSADDRPENAKTGCQYGLFFLYFVPFGLQDSTIKSL
jgi:hypothetical protein